MKSIIISENLIKNGRFGTDEYWRKQPGVIFSGNKAIIVPSSGISQAFSVPQKSIYRLVFTISEPNLVGITGYMILISNARLGDDGQPIDSEVLLETPITGAKTYQLEGELSEHQGIEYHLELAIASTLDENASFKVEDVQFYLIDEKSTAPHPGQLLLNGDFSEGLEHWEHSTNVTENDGKAFLSGASSIEQLLKHSSSKSYTLKFDISNIKGSGTALVYNGLKTLSFDSDGAYLLEFPRDESNADITVGFATNGSFEIDNVVLFATPE